MVYLPNITLLTTSFLKMSMLLAIINAFLISSVVSVVILIAVTLVRCRFDATSIERVISGEELEMRVRLNPVLCVGIWAGLWLSICLVMV